MPTYSFQMSARVAGSSVSVTAAGSSTVVASGTLDANALFTASLPVGDYVATAAGGHYQYRSAGTVVQPDSDQLADYNYGTASDVRAALTPSFRYNRGRYSIISAFQAGHGWVSGGNTANLTDDAADFGMGSQSLKFTTLGNASNGSIRKTGMAPINLTGKGIAMLLKVDDVTKLDKIRLYVGTGTFAAFKIFNLGSGGDNPSGGAVPVNSLHSNEYAWVHTDLSTYDTFTTTGTPDMTAITDFQAVIVDKNAAVTVHLAAIATYTKASAFPSGVVSFTFDDSYIDHYTRARPTLDKYGMAATAYTIADRVGTANMMTVAQLRELEAFSGWEVAGHAYTAANHDAGLTTLDAATLDTDLAKMKSWLLANGFTKGADLFAYPLGKENLAVQQAVSRYYTSARWTSADRYPGLPMANQLRAQAVTITASFTPAMAQAAIDVAFSSGKWIIFVLHQIDASGATGQHYNQADLDTIAAYCVTKGVPVRTVGEVLRSTSAQA